MQNLINFLSFPIGWIILVVIFIVALLFRMAYVAQTKELSVKYAKIVLKKYKDSRSKTITPMFEYLYFAIASDNPNWNWVQITNRRKRIFRNWFKCHNKQELKYFKKRTLKHSVIVYNDNYWFSDTNKDTRMYFLKKVISRNSK